MAHLIGAYGTLTTMGPLIRSISEDTRREGRDDFDGGLVGLLFCNQNVRDRMIAIYQTDCWGLFA